MGALLLCTLLFSILLPLPISRASHRLQTKRLRGWNVGSAIILSGFAQDLSTTCVISYKFLLTLWATGALLSVSFESYCSVRRGSVQGYVFRSVRQDLAWTLRCGDGGVSFEFKISIAHVYDCLFMLGYESPVSGAGHVQIYLPRCILSCF